MNSIYQHSTQNKEFFKAISWVWMIISIILISILCLSIAGNPEKILAIVPTCIAKESGQSCFLCGSTQAFLSIGNFDFRKALLYNLYSPFLYFLFLINSYFFIFYYCKTIKTKFFT